MPRSTFGKSVAWMRNSSARAPYAQYERLEKSPPMMMMAIRELL
jgi:hypothetical protein